MLSENQMNYALSLTDFDCFYDEVADVTVRTCHGPKGIYFLIMNEAMDIYEELSCFLPYIWVAAANTRLWPRDSRGGLLYYTQVSVEKKGKLFKNKYLGTCTDKDRERFSSKLFNYLKATK